MKKRICKHCGKKYQPIYKSQHYCNKCKNTKIKCPVCKKWFIPKLFSQTKKYWEGKVICCSNKCARKRQTQTNYLKRICKHCGEEFLTNHPQTKYCNTCRNTKIQCPTCKKSFIPKTIIQLERYWNGEEVYCSRECADKSEIKHKKMSEAWKNKSEEEIKQIINKSKATYKEKTGYDNPSQNPEIKEQKKETYLEHFGYEHNFAVPEIIEQKKKTYLEHYGVDSPLKCTELMKEALARYKEKTGYDYPAQNPEVKEKIRAAQFAANDGHYAFNTPEVREKIRVERAKNGPHSNEEILFKQKLLELGLVEDEDFKLEYNKDERYPFNCDFYLVKEDLFIEINIYFSHGHHWYNSEDVNDQKTLKLWQEKAKNSEHYQNAINVWTNRDPLKRKIARKNKLNYVVLWTQQDITDWFEAEMPNGQDWKEEYSWKKN